ncbi:hypothetical protein C8R44DRAFT_858966 [Mycena epipterygia]|nr:hypothetical protein C8R44DRAFT_858966 [Mycena epipterygia]
MNVNRQLWHDESRIRISLHSSSAVTALSNQRRPATTIPTCPRRRPRSQCSPSRPPRPYFRSSLSASINATTTRIAFSIAVWMAAGRAFSTFYIRNTYLTYGPYAHRQRSSINSPRVPANLETRSHSDHFGSPIVLSSPVSSLSTVAE